MRLGFYICIFSPSPIQASNMQAHDSVSTPINDTIQYQWLGKQDLRHACFESFQIKFIASFEPLG